jgi:hypothetical protein
MPSPVLSVAPHYCVALIISLRELLPESLTEEHTIPCPNCGKAIATEKYCSGCGTPNPITYIDESVKVSRTRVMRRQQKRELPTRAIIVGSSVAVVMLIATFFANSYALSNMQYRVVNVSDFDYTTLASDVTIQACNPTAFPTGFDKFSAIVDYRQGEFARISVDGGSVMPFQASSFDGQLKLSAQTVSGLVIALADAIGGTDSPYNENDITLVVTMDARILGIVPYTHTQEFTFSQFQQFMGAQQADQYQCG